MSASDALVLRRVLAEQRQAIVEKIEAAALHVLANADENGAPVIAEALRQAAEIARWTIFDPSEADAARRASVCACGMAVQELGGPAPEEEQP